MFSVFVEVDLGWSTMLEFGAVVAHACSVSGARVSARPGVLDDERD